MSIIYTPAHVDFVETSETIRNCVQTARDTQKQRFANSTHLAEALQYRPKIMMG